MNENSKTPHFIALYIDDEFKKGLKQLSDAEISS